MYEALFSTKLLTASAAVLLALLTGALVGRPTLGLRGLAYGFGPMLAAAFFVAAMLVASTRVDSFDAVAGFTLEFTILCIYLSLLRTMLATLQGAEKGDVTRLLTASLALQALLMVVQFNSVGFGIFSEGSRIDYLYGGSLAKYFTYAGIMMAAAQAALIAHRISYSGGPGWLGAAVIVLAFATSVVGGSKGGVFLWMISIIALIDYRRTRISWSAGALTLLVLAAAFVTSSVVVADFLGLNAQEFADLLLSRIFLNNDARALAFDFRNGSTENAGLLRESFRSLATLFGVPPENPPIGIRLYDELLGDAGGNGANASLSALILFYFPSGYAIVPAIAACGGAFFLGAFFKATVRVLRRASSRVLVLAFALFAVQQYSQDFLAFQVVMPLTIVAIAGVWLYEQRGRLNTRRTRLAKQLPAHPRA